MSSVNINCHTEKLKNEFITNSITVGSSKQSQTTPYTMKDFHNRLVILAHKLKETSMLKNYFQFIKACDQPTLEMCNKDFEKLYYEFAVYDLGAGSLDFVKWMMNNVDLQNFYLRQIIQNSYPSSIKLAFEMCFLYKFDYEVLKTFFEFTGLEAKFSNPIGDCQLFASVEYIRGSAKMPSDNGSYHYVTVTIPFVTTGIASAFYRRTGLDFTPTFEQLKDHIDRAIKEKHEAIFQMLASMLVDTDEEKNCKITSHKFQT